MNIWKARHGDIPVFSVAEIPSNAEKLDHNGQFTVALGEATGHHHTLYAEDMEIYKHNNIFFAKLNVETPLRHQEHKEIIIPKGLWAFGREVERDPFMDTISEVKD